jgi:DNA-binding transcriptional LysR family regulator
VSPTGAGERLLQTIGPRFEEIQAELDALSKLREKPAGTIRITTTDYAADTIFWPKMSRFLWQNPDKSRDHHRLWLHRHRRWAVRRQRAQR